MKNFPSSKEGIHPSNSAEITSKLKPVQTQSKEIILSELQR
jgi:hypothetical protein